MPVTPQRSPFQIQNPLDDPYTTAILLGMNRMGKHVYGGTVSDEVVLRRRAKNRVARRSRRINRMRSK